MALIVVGTGEDGYREILGFKTRLRETAESWRELLGELKKRGLSSVELATSDAHEGLVGPEGDLPRMYLEPMSSALPPQRAR